MRQAIQGSSSRFFGAPKCHPFLHVVLPKAHVIACEYRDLRCCRDGVFSRIRAQTSFDAVETESMSSFLESLKWDKQGLVAVIAQHVDTGEVLMQAYADRAAINETLHTRLGTFYSRSRKGRWCKGETSGHYLKVQRVFMDCDRDSIIYLCDPIGPACHTGARTCWFTEAALDEQKGEVVTAGEHDDVGCHHVPRTTLFALEHTIEERKLAARQNPAAKPSWTARLLEDPVLLCKKIREEAGEVCQTWEQQEGKERAASEMADLMYHCMVMMNLQGVSMEEVLRVLRKRFDQSGIEEKAARGT